MSDILVLPNLPETAIVYEEKEIGETTYYINNLDVIVKDGLGREIERTYVARDDIEYLRGLIEVRSNLKEENRETEEASLRFGEELRRARIKG